MAPLDNELYLPLVVTPRLTRTANVPHFPASGIVFTETAVVWFGGITPANNYTDVRLGYTDNYLWVRLNIFDRLLWYDPTPTPASLTLCDSASLYLRRDGGVGAPSSQTYRFDAALNSFQTDRTPWQQAYTGNGSTWVPGSLEFTTLAGIRWQDTNTGGINNGENNRGWSLSFRVPFSSLGMSGPPPQGSAWSAGVVVYDQESDCQSSPPAPVVSRWPEGLQGSNSAAWGIFRFGLPASPPLPPPGSPSVTIREGLNGAVVPDAAIGGTIGNLCPGDPTFIWNTWSNLNFGSAPDVNIQNQGDLADWPCFARYYVTFPLSQVPPGKSLLSARFTMHHWGGSDLDAALPSLLQVFSVAEDWSENNLTWNNAPLALENVARTWENPYTQIPPDWPGQPVTWDVTSAVLRAYSRNEPVRLAVYSADAAQHSGKYFTTSETGEWNAVGRPTLIVTWAGP